MITLFSMLFPQLVVQHGGWVAMLLIVLCGVPHGATDHLLFGYVRKDFNEGWMYRFASRYLLLMGLLIVGWMILPSLALMIFLAISVYHFGQSQLYYIQLPTAVRLLLYSSWGAFALFTPLLWNYPETQPIVASLTGLDLYLPSHYQLFIPIGLALFITLSTLVLFLFDRLTVADLIWENFVLLVLLFLFSATPLLVGFATYFVFWHSYDSMRDQYQQFSTYQPAYTLRTYIQQIIPFFFLALLSLVGFSWWTSAPLLSDAWIGQFFMLISIVTLPHSILMDAFLENSKANQQNVHEKTQQGGVEQVWQAQ
ncbi:MAG: Brp/Blh family beta-carotene 15,15'-dioxygenase [Saprospiraceae bacterium]